MFTVVLIFNTKRQYTGNFPILIVSRKPSVLGEVFSTTKKKKNCSPWYLKNIKKKFNFHLFSFNNIQNTGVGLMSIGKHGRGLSSLTPFTRMFRSDYEKKRISTSMTMIPRK